MSNKSHPHGIQICVLGFLLFVLHALEFELYTIFIQNWADEHAIYTHISCLTLIWWSASDLYKGYELRCRRGTSQTKMTKYFITGGTDSTGSCLPKQNTIHPNDAAVCGNPGTHNWWGGQYRKFAKIKVSNRTFPKSNQVITMTRAIKL